FDTVHSGEPNIAEHHVGMHGRQKLQRLLRVTPDLAFVAVLGEECLHRACEVALVVNDEDGRAVHWGSQIVTVVPSPTRLVRSRRPPCCSTNLRAVATPRPVPSGRVLKNGSPMEGSTCSGIPEPVSCTVTARPGVSPDGSSRPAMTSRPPDGMASRALETSSTNTCSSFIGSTLTSGSDAGRSCS